MFCPKCGERLQRKPDEQDEQASSTSPDLPASATRQMAPLSASGFHDLVDDIQASSQEWPAPPAPIPPEQAESKQTAMFVPEIRARILTGQEEPTEAKDSTGTEDAPASSDARLDPRQTAAIGSDALSRVREALTDTDWDAATPASATQAMPSFAVPPEESGDEQGGRDVDFPPGPPASGSAASRTMVLDQVDFQEWLDEMGVPPDEQDDRLLTDSTDVLVQAEQAVERGDYPAAIDRYLLLIRSFPEETTYQTRLSELWEWTRRDDVEWEERPTSSPARRGLIIAVVGTLVGVFLGVLWFRSPAPPPASSPHPSAPRQPTERRVTTPSPVATLQIHSTPPGADVWLDGKPLEKTTPTTFRQGQGSYVLALRKEGYQPLQMRIQLQPGQTFAAQFALTPAPAKPRPRRRLRRRKSARRVGLRVQSTPAGATVFLNDRSTGKQTPTTLRLRPGNYQLQLRREGYQTHIRFVSVRASANPPLAIDLVTKTRKAQLSVETKPPGAEVLLNGKPLKRRTPLVVPMPSSPFTLTLRRKGYRELKKRVTPPPGKNLSLRYPLRPKGHPGMVYVPAGAFWRGNNAGRDRERPMRKITLRGFWIDRTEVTVAAYQRCVKAGRCRAPARKPGCNRPDTPKHPVNCVSWRDAFRYCKWNKKRLPTEAEWEKAARGRTPQLYPWGHDAPTCQRARYKRCDGQTRPVGVLPAGRSPFGALDMAGNVWEWVLDRYRSDFYKQSGDTNPVNLSGRGQYRVIRGGAWDSPSDRLHVTYRADYWSSQRTPTVGFRCAR